MAEPLASIGARQLRRRPVLPQQRRGGVVQRRQRIIVGGLQLDTQGSERLGNRFGRVPIGHAEEVPGVGHRLVELLPQPTGARLRLGRDRLPGDPVEPHAAGGSPRHGGKRRHLRVHRGGQVRVRDLGGELLPQCQRQLRVAGGVL
jgi:hypothetical protein